MSKLLELLSSSTASRKLRYPDSSNRSVKHRILRFAEEWPNQLDLNSNVLGLCKDVMVKALAPYADISDTELWCSVYSLLQTLHFSDIDLLVIEEKPLHDFLITYRRQFPTTNYEFYVRTKGWIMELDGSAKTLGLLLEDVVQEGREFQSTSPDLRCPVADSHIVEFSGFNNLFSIFLQQLAYTGVSAELRHPTGTDTSVRERILLFAEEWPHQIDPHSATLNLCKDALLKALTLDPDKEFWYSMYRILNSFYFSKTELGIIEENRLQSFRINYRLFFLENVEPTIERVLEKPEIMKSILKKATADECK